MKKIKRKEAVVVEEKNKMKIAEKTNQGLIEEAKRGNQDAWRVLYKRYFSKFKIIKRKALERYNKEYDHSINSAIDDGFIDAVFHWEKKGKFETFLERVIWRRLFKMPNIGPIRIPVKAWKYVNEEKLKKVRKHFLYTEDILDGNPFPDQIAEDNEIQHLIKRIINNKLSKRERYILIQRMDGSKLREIAEVLGVSITLVASIQKKTIEKIKWIILNLP